MLGHFDVIFYRYYKKLRTEKITNSVEPASSSAIDVIYPRWFYSGSTQHLYELVWMDPEEVEVTQPHVRGGA